MTKNFNKKSNSNSLEGNKVLKLTAWLENRNHNITNQLACTCGELIESIIKTFEDFRLVAQIKKAIEKVKPTPNP